VQRPGEPITPILKMVELVFALEGQLTLARDFSP
jgi:hypothetical protein